MTGPPPGADLQAELVRLRAENAALNEQVKLLVLTEQRLYRSQNELDSQLGLVRALANFGLESSTLEEPCATLARALELLGSAFPIDWAGFVHATGEAREVSLAAVLEGQPRVEGPRQVSPETFDWLAAPPAADWCGYGADGDAAPWQLLRALAPELLPGHEAARPARVAFVALQGMEAFPPGVLLVASLRPRPAFLRGDPLGERHLPYLTLLANHVDHALASASLTRRLHERTAELLRSMEQFESTQQALLQAQKMEAIGRLAGGVAHDFNNLLTVILGYAGTLAASLPPRSPARENVDKVTAAAQRAASLTRQLLTLGRRQVQRRETFSLGDQCSRTVDLLRRLVGEDIRIEVEFAGARDTILADRSQLEQVLLNLMVNARDAMPRGGRLRIVTRPATAADAARSEGALEPSRFVVLEVADEGVGMDAMTLERIFEPFFTTKPSGQGTGLGLAVVYGIVMQSEGHILVDSEPGAGTCFRVLLPLSAAPAAAGSTPVSAAPEPPAGRAGAVILVVEDEAAIREVVHSTLRRSGYVVLEAADGEAALARIAKHPPDLVLTDVLMPRMGGSALSRELEARFPAVRVAFMSGYAADFGEDEGAAGRLARFLPKPFTAEELRAFVARQLAGDAVPGASA